MTGPAAYSAADVEVIIGIIVAVTVAFAVLVKRASRRRPQPARRNRAYLPASRYGPQPGSEVPATCRCCRKRPAEYDGECAKCLSYWECLPD